MSAVKARGRQVMAKAVQAHEVDTVGALLRDQKHSVSPEESEKRKQEFDRVEKAHRGVSWPIWRPKAKTT